MAFLVDIKDKEKNILLDSLKNGEKSFLMITATSNDKGLSILEELYKERELFESNEISKNYIIEEDYFEKEDGSYEASLSFTRHFK